MLNALEKVMYPNGKTKALGDITSGSVSSIIDEVHNNTSAISAINNKLEHLTYDSETEKYNMSSGLNVRWHLVAQHHLRANDFDLGENNAGFRNSIYRGKNLGTSVTAEQWDSIESGAFDNMFIGDYWTINGVKWRIAGFDYWLGTGNDGQPNHHVVIVPDTSLADSAMKNTDTTDGGYIGSTMYTTTHSSILTIIETAFGASHILQHKEVFTNSVSDGSPATVQQVDNKVCIMSELEVLGHNVFAKAPGMEIGFDKTQLPLFAHNPNAIICGKDYWLRDISGNTYTLISIVGGVTWGAPTSVKGTRPIFGIYNSTTQQSTNTRKKASKKKGE